MSGQVADPMPGYHPDSVLGRSVHPRVLDRFGRVVRAVERIHPRIAADLALAGWSRTPPPRPATRGPGLPDSEISSLPWRHGRFVTEAWPASGPTVLLVHGWAGNRRQLDAFVPGLLAAGMRVVQFDAPNHGQSQPRRAATARRWTLPHFVWAVQAVARREVVTGVVAHSLGAVATTLALLDGAIAPRAVAFVAPAPLSQLDFAREFGRMLGLRESTQDRMAERLPAAAGRPRTWFDLPGRLAHAPHLPAATIAHDRDDLDSPMATAYELAGLWPGATILETRGLGHSRILRDPDAVGHVVAHLRGHLRGERPD